MRKIIFGCAILLAALLFAGGCRQETSAGPVTAGAGLPPVAWLAAQITGTPVPCALPAGRSPHDYNPSPAVLRSLTEAKLFFTTGQAFEQKLAEPLTAAGVRVVDVTAGIKRLPLEAGCADHDHDHDHDHDAGALDPHVWTSPENCEIIAAAILDSLLEADPENAETYRRNAGVLMGDIAAVRTQLTELLAPCRGRAFFVYHPAFGYFAAEFGLHQIGIEIGGREPSPARLAEVIAGAKQHRVQTIFVQPQFNPAAAGALAAAIGGSVAELDPLAADVLSNFRRIAEEILKGCD